MLGWQAVAADPKPISLAGPRGTLVLNERGLSLTPREAGAPAIVAEDSPLWTITLQKVAALPVIGERRTFSAQGQAVQQETLPDGARLIYPALTDGKETWKVSLILEIRQKGEAFEISGELKNGVEGWLIADFAGPILSGIQADLTRQPLLWPVGLGQRINGTPFSASRGSNASVTARASSWKVNKDTAELSANYPSAMGCMPWCALAGAEGGLYVGCHDPLHGGNTLVAQAAARNVGLQIMFKHKPVCATGQRWALPPLVVLPYAGSWHVAAKYYRAWFDSVSKLYEAPAWVQSASGWLLCILKQQNGLVMWDYPALEKLCDVADERGLDILGLFGWTQGGHDHLYPEYLPDQALGGADGLRKVLEKAHQRGKRAIIYANGQLIGTNTEFWANEGKALAVMQENGVPVEQTYHKYKTFPAQHFGIACLGTKAWHDRMLALAVQAHDLGADGILYDQLGMHGPQVCYAANHGHAVPAVVYTGERPVLIQRIVEHMKKVNPNFIVMTEGLHDTVLNSISLFHGCILGEFTPTESEMAGRINRSAANPAFPEMFRYAFPEVMQTQRQPTPMLDRLGANYACVYGLRHEIESRYAPDVLYLRASVMPKTKDYADVVSPPNVAMMQATPPQQATQYLKQIIDFQRRHADILWQGRFVDDEGFVFKGEGLLAKGYAAKGKLGVLVWNPTSKEATFSLSVPRGKLLSAAEPERASVEALGPLPPQSVRLLIWQQ